MSSYQQNDLIADVEYTKSNNSLIVSEDKTSNKHIMDILCQYFVPGILHDSSRLVLGVICSCLSSLCSGFGNALEANSILASLHLIFLFFSIDFYFPTRASLSLKSKDFWIAICLMIFIQAWGFCLGFQSAVGYPHTTFGTIMEAFGFGIVIWIIISILTIYPYAYAIHQYPNSSLMMFSFPVFFTLANVSLVGNVFSCFFSIGNSVLDYEPLRQSASLFGIAFINWYFVYMIMVIYQLCLFFINVFPPTKDTLQHTLFTTTLYSYRNLIHHVKYFVLFTISLFLITGFLKQSSNVYEVNVSHLLRDQWPVSCVFSQNVDYNSTDYIQLMDTTYTRLISGDRIVMMSEEAITVYSDSQETELINAGYALLLNATQTIDQSEEVLLGITYEKSVSNEDYSTNKFVLYSSIQGLIWNYQKVHPVPIVESNIHAGKNPLPTHSHSAFGSLAGGICFDLDFPQYIRPAGTKQIDLFLQPSWTWNALDKRHFDDNAIRAVENGFTLFRCSSDGESGVVDPLGRFLHRQYTGHQVGSVALFQLPQTKSMPKLFPFFGFIFEYVNIAVAGMIYVYMMKESCFSSSN